MKDAGAGCIIAQRELADRALALALEPGDALDPFTLLIEGAVFARLAAARGAKEDHERCVAIAGHLTGFLGADDDICAEAIARIELMAEDGCDESAQFLPTYAPQTTPAMMQLAQSFAARLRLQKEHAQ
jgi:phosphosulfolactate phosphohydrolase-like enzyme